MPDRTDNGHDRSVFDLTSVPGQGQTTELVEKVDNLIDNIEMHFLQQLQQHEDDFINAYKGQMEKVRKELTFLQ